MSHNEQPPMTGRVKMTEAEWRNLEDLRKHWNDYCDSDPFEGSDTFIERMEQQGYAELVPVTEEALNESFAAERGIEPGGVMWQLTDAGRAAITKGG